MDNENGIDPLEIRKEFTDTTKKSSDLCRYIVFALFAAVWAYFKDGAHFTFNKFTCILILLLFLYVIIDILQLFIPACWCNNIYNRDEKGTLTLNDVNNEHNKLSKWMFRLLSFKIIFLILICIAFIITAFILSSH